MHRFFHRTPRLLAVTFHFLRRALIRRAVITSQIAEGLLRLTGNFVPLAFYCAIARAHGLAPLRCC